MSITFLHLVPLEKGSEPQTRTKEEERERERERDGGGEIGVITGLVNQKSLKDFVEESIALAR